MITTAEEFYRLRSSDDPNEYRRAAHEEASEEVWLEVIQKYPEMKVWVVHNKKVPLSILRILSDDTDAEVRSWVAGKRKLDAALLEKLSRDPEESVRRKVAIHGNTPARVLESLCRDESEFVSEAARQSLKEAGKETERLDRFGSPHSC
ncbi:MAG: hypothetical protein QNJ67_09810 [Kiloniellales bacterium]|nr:hypothetical protein [Kiloniellales bacterium]